MGNTNLSDGNKCPICRKLGADINSNARNDFFLHYRCTNCGCFFVPDTYRIYPEIRLEDIYNLQHLQSYLFYHKSNLSPVICKKEYFNKHITDEFVEIYNITPEMVESWYPKNFAEKNDCILLYLNKNSQYIGHEKVYTYRELVDIFMLENSIETFKGIPNFFIIKL